MDNSIFAVRASKNDIPKPVERLSTYPQGSWITGLAAEIVGMTCRALRQSSTGLRFVPISPTSDTRIIHNVGDLSTEKRRLSPEDVESSVL